MSRLLSIRNFTWLALYLAVMAGLTVAMFGLRGWSQQQLDTGEAREQWDEWKEETARQAAGEGPVKRREAESSEPPTLALLRDYFGVMLGAALGFASLIFGTFMLLWRGALATPSLPQHVQAPTHLPPQESRPRAER